MRAKRLDDEMVAEMRARERFCVECEGSWSTNSHELCITCGKPGITREVLERRRKQPQTTLFGENE